MEPKLIVAIVAIVAIVLGGASVIAAVIGTPRRRGDPLDRITKLIQIHDAIPASSTAKPKILARLEAEVEQLSDMAAARRNPYGVFWGVTFLGVAGSGIWLIAQAGGTWWWLSPVPIVIGVAGAIVIGQNVTRVPRASNGQTLEYQRKQREKKSAS